MDNIAKKIDELYNKSSFTEKYGGSVFMTILIFLAFFIALSYFWVIAHSQPIKDDWVNQRCSPAVIPFAGLIMNPQDESAFDYTATNFSGCVNSILTEITSIFLIPINAFLNVIMLVWSEALDAINVIRDLINSIRDAFTSVSQDVYGRILGILIPIQKMFISIRDMFAKTQGIMTATMFTGLGVYDTMLTGVSATWELMMIIFIVITVAIIILLSLFFTIPAGLIALAVYIPIAIIMIEFLVLVSDVMKVSGLSPMPKTPSCFASGTLIDTKEKKVKIEDIPVGIILKDDSHVTSIMKLSSYNQLMYNLNGTIVSDTHKVLYNNEFISVPNHPEAFLIEEFLEPFIYCFNTSNKVININNTIFTDWDDLDEMDLHEIKLKSNKYFNTENFKPSDIHKYLESGFKGETLIELENGNSIYLKDIEVNDILKFGERVIGTVEIDCRDIKTFKHVINGKTFHGGANLQIYKFDLGIFNNTLDDDIYSIEDEKSEKYDKLYHILTDKNSLVINGIIFYDYNGAIDSFLEKSDFKLLANNFQ